MRNPFEGKGKRYNDFNGFLRRTFGVRVHKITLDAGLGCPNRDGTVSSKGCIYCNERGSGTGAWRQGVSIREQILRAQTYLRKRFKAEKFLAYFQSFSNTYAHQERLEALYREALEPDDMVGLSIGTRPDCVPEDTLAMIQGFTGAYMVWLEYGLQSFHDRTLTLINRGHTVEAFLDAVNRTRSRGINVCVHVILGLPGEGTRDMMETADRLSMLDIQGIKIHLLYVVKGTPLARLYERGEYTCLTREEYVDILISFIARLRSGIIIQRITGDPHPEDLLAPSWSLDKGEVLALIHTRMEQEDVWQGKEYTGYPDTCA